MRKKTNDLNNNLTQPIIETKSGDDEELTQLFYLDEEKDSHLLFSHQSSENELFFKSIIQAVYSNGIRRSCFCLDSEDQIRQLADNKQQFIEVLRGMVNEANTKGYKFRHKELTKLAKAIYMLRQTLLIPNTPSNVLAECEGEFYPSLPGDQDPIVQLDELYDDVHTLLDHALSGYLYYCGEPYLNVNIWSKELEEMAESKTTECENENVEDSPPGPGIS